MSKCTCIDEQISRAGTAQLSRVASGRMKMSKFMIFSWIILVITTTTLLSTTFADESSDDECKKIVESARQRLKKYLFCDYLSYGGLPTLNEKNGTEVSVGVAPRMASFDEETGNLEIFGWMFISWNDPHLTWTPSSFEDIKWLRVQSYELWEPYIAVMSTGNENSNEMGLPYTRCYLSRKGMVICTPQVRHTIRCETDFAQWPYDRQNCTLALSTWAQSNQQIRFAEKVNETIVMDFFQSNGEWKLTASRVSYDQRKSTFSRKNETYSPRVSIDFILDRVHNQLSGRYISPAIIMMVLTLTTLWLDPRSIERLAVACVNPLIHLYCISNLHWVLPHNGSTVPSILLFYAYSLIFATVALLLTFILGNLGEITIDPPKWISSSTATVLRSKIGQILLLSMLDPKVAAELEPDADDSGDLVSSKPKTGAWGYVAIMCGWLSVLVIFLGYIIMYAVLVPNSSMRPPIKSIGYFDLLQ